MNAPFITPQAYVDCVGFVVRVEIFDHRGALRSTQHGRISRSHAAAVKLSRGSVKGLCLPTDRVVRTIVPVCTAFPLSAVYAGEATRWEDWEVARQARAA